VKRALVILLSVTLAASGCAANQKPRYQAPAAPAIIPAASSALADFARNIAPGTQVRATTPTQRISGTLLKVSDTAVVIQPRTRIPEPVIEVRFTELEALELQREGGSSIGRSIAIGAAVGAGAAVGTLLLLFALLGGD
jgi:hypothetical protein